MSLLEPGVGGGLGCGISVSNKRPPASDRDRDWPAGMEDVLGVGSHSGRVDGHLSLPHDVDETGNDRAAACAWPEVEASQKADMVEAEESAQCKHVFSVACHHSNIAAVRQITNQKCTCMRRRPCEAYATTFSALSVMLND